MIWRGKKFLRRKTAIAIAAMALFSFSPIDVSAVSVKRADPALNHRPGEIVVLFKDSTILVKLKFADDTAAEAAIREYRKNPAVRSVDWNYLFRVSAERLNADDEYLANQWYLEKIRAPEAWVTNQGSKSVVVAVLDTGVDLDHPDLRNNIWTNPYESLDGIDNDNNGYPDDIHGWDFVNSVGDPKPRFNSGFTEAGVNHGTIISGIIGAVGNNRVGVAGVNWNVRIMPVKVLDDQGLGDVITVGRGIDYAIKNGAKVLNLSFVGLEQSAILADAISRAYNAGAVVVAAAGNDSAWNGGRDLDANPNYPVCSDGGPGKNYVIGVAATDEQDHKAAFSGYGAKCVDIAAPGVAFWSARFQDSKIPNFGNFYGGYWQGTSLATAVVSGAAALLKAVSPDLNNDEIRQFLTSSAAKIDSINPTYAGKIGSGRLDLAEAVKKVSAARPEIKYSRALIGTGAPAGAKPEIKLFTPSGAFVRSFNAYNDNFKGGVNVAAGDIDGDSYDEIVTAPASSGGPHVKIFDTAGHLKNEFFAFERTMTVGVNLAVADLDDDGRAEIVTAPASGGSEIKVWSNEGRMLGDFLAYGPDYKGGVSVAAGDVDSDGRAEIITAPLKGGGPHIRVFDMKGSLKNQFFAGDTKDLRGWRVAVGDTQKQGSDSIGVLPNFGKADVLNLFNGLGVLYGVLEFSTSVQKFPFAFGDVDSDGRSDVLISVPTSEGVSVSVHDTDGKEKAYVVSYPKPTVVLPALFVVSRP
jgi:subtilisin family serine protease